MYGIEYDGFVDYIRACGEPNAFEADVQIIDECGEYQPYSFDEVEVMEFTERKDKDGGKIYEGDIVRGALGCDIDPCLDVGIVKLGEFEADSSGKEYRSVNCFGWHYEIIASRYPEDYDGSFPGKNSEVIGNIYENPELLSK